MKSSGVIWIFGLSGAGKTTLAKLLAARLKESNIEIKHFDGDEIRAGLSKDLGFSESDRLENMRRVAEATKEYVTQNRVVIVSLISPLKKGRERVRKILESEAFYEVYLNCDLDICEKRDTKGLYKQARQGEIENFTGIDSTFESPEYTDLEINTGKLSVEESFEKLIQFTRNSFGLS